MMTSTERPSFVRSGRHIQEVIICHDHEGLPAGAIFLCIQWRGTEYQVFHNGRPQLVDLGEWSDGHAKPTGRRIVESEYPNYLFPVYVPGPFYHGHHLYLDGEWLRFGSPRGDHPLLPYLLRLCGKELSDFPYGQDFFRWFMEQYPAGCFLCELEEKERPSR